MRPLHVSCHWLLWLAAGAGLGALLEHWRCAGRHGALLAELVQRLAQLEAELRQLRVKMKRGGSISSQQSRRRNVTSAVSLASFYDVPGPGRTDSSSDEFYDAESEAAHTSASVMFGLVAPEGSATSPEVQDLLARVDDLLAGGDESHRGAHDLLLESLRRDRGLASQAPVLLRWAKACLCLHWIEAAAGNRPAAADFLGQADAASAQALELDTGSAECHAVRAKTLGLVIRDKGVKEKVTGGIKFRQLVERGLELDPEHADLLEMQACFLYEVSRVGWLERKTAVYLFGPDCLPEARLEDAQRVMDRAVAARPSGGSVSALYWAARCRLEAGVDLPGAVDLLRRALEAPLNGVEDRRLRDDAAKLLGAYA